MNGFFETVDRNQTPFFIFSILSEGHTGVSLFMALSGYIFAKIIDDKDIHFGNFL